jgi:hypothetical protein
VAKVHLFHFTLAAESEHVFKVTFHDGKNFISKTDYAEKGPKAVLEMSASLF